MWAIGAVAGPFCVAKTDGAAMKTPCRPGNPGNSKNMDCPFNAKERDCGFVEGEDGFVPGFEGDFGRKSTFDTMKKC